jgi:hypothetical protein
VSEPALSAVEGGLCGESHFPRPSSAERTIC